MGNELGIIVAVARNGVIGQGGKMPWGNTYKDDLRHFRKTTMGHPIIMGRKTWESLPRKPLPGRKNIVITRHGGTSPSDHQRVTSLVAALGAARMTGQMPFVIGGESIYKMALPLASHIYMTRIARDYDGDTYFPALDQYMWVERGLEIMGDLTFLVYRSRQHNLEAQVKKKKEGHVTSRCVIWVIGWKRVEKFRVLHPRLWWALLQQNDDVRDDLIEAVMCSSLLEKDRQYLWRWAEFTEKTQPSQ